MESTARAGGQRSRFSFRKKKKRFGGKNILQISYLQHRNKLESAELKPDLLNSLYLLKFEAFYLLNTDRRRGGEYWEIHVQGGNFTLKNHLNSPFLHFCNYFSHTCSPHPEIKPRVSSSFLTTHSSQAPRSFGLGLTVVSPVTYGSYQAHLYSRGLQLFLSVYHLIQRKALGRFWTIKTNEFTLLLVAHKQLWCLH